MWGSERSELREEQGAGLFVDIAAPAPRILIFGAVDFAAALCRTARVTRWRPYVIDPRSRFATPERFPEAEEVIAGWPADAVAHLGGIDRATYLVVLTHDPKLDDAALAVALDSDAPYIGAMGSRRAQAKRRERLPGGRDRRGAARAHLRADRPRHRGARLRGDGSVDHGRGGGGPEWPPGRAPGQRERADPRGRLVPIGPAGSPPRTPECRACRSGARRPRSAPSTSPSPCQPPRGRRSRCSRSRRPRSRSALPSSSP